MAGWIGVDLDGTLAEYDGWRGIEHIGAPIPLMVERVKNWLNEDQEVRIFTARASETDPEMLEHIVHEIEVWCEEHIGAALPVTNIKDFAMIELWDDRCIQVEANTGRPIRDWLTNWLGPGGVTHG